MKQHLKYILLLLVFLGLLKQSIAQTTISSSVTLTQSILNGYTWPVIINGGTSVSPLIVTLGENVTLSNSQNYFIINGDYVTFEGNKKTITLASNVSYYSGLIQNGNSNANGFNNLTVQNLGVLSNNLSGFYAGWIGQEHFSKNASSNLVINCYSTGNINNYGGGIIGANSSGSAIQCYSTGNIGYNSGGIFGQNSSSCTANNCYTGGIYNTNDGIFGNNATNKTKTNCYAANGNFNTSTANSNLTGTDGTVWNTNFNPYRLSVFFPIIISSSITLTQTVLDSYTWPIIINGGTSVSPLIVTLGEDVTLTNSQNYFIINGSYVTFEGNNKTITISGISSYTGLIKNGFYELVSTNDPNDPYGIPTQTINSTNGFNNLTIQNLGVLAVNSDVAAGQGWIGQSSFALNASNNLIINCYSNGPLRQSSGGIIGEKSYGTVKKSYSTGAQIGGWAGGIFGSESHGTAENCFSTAPSFGNRGGGIFGGEASNATATNCYSLGTINSNCGGIFGGFTSNCTATNCYSTGAVGTNAGGIFGGNSSSVTATNCYIANNAWVSNDANTALTGEDGTVWNTNTSPYTLIALATLITSNTSIDQTWINKRVYNLPILLDANVTVTILEDLTFTDANCYFAVRATGVTFDGNFKKITIKDITNYRGLVNNGNYLGNNVAAISGSIVKNIGVLSNNSSLKEYCGWIGQQGYGNGADFSITYCYSNGNMTNDGTGGILGQAYMNGTISNCYSLGNISGSSSAGIVASRNSTASKIINCYSNGSITGSNAYGICNIDFMMIMMGRSSFTNCYAANGAFSSTTANSNLTGTDGTVWNTSVTPYSLSVFLPQKWGLSRNGLKTQDNTIQLDINGKKGTSSPVNENGKVN